MTSIICADDDNWIRILYDNILKKRYENLRILSCGQEVLDAFKEEPADLLVIDINMPGLSGIEVCKRIRNDGSYPNVSIIIVSSEKTEDAIVNGFLAGADDYIIKPINPSELLAKMVIAMNKRVTNVSKLLGIFPGTIFAGRYEVIEKLGKGSFSNVYHARDISTKPHKDVALKVFDLPPSSLNDQKFMALFLREAYGLSKLDFPSIVKLYDFGTANFYFLVMEYLKGETLQDRVEKSGPLSEYNAQIIAYEAAKILRYLETCKLVHRDIKPINIMITDDGYLKLLDFGLARYENEGTIIFDDLFKGTPQFAAPESIYGDHDIDLTSDIFSLGATLYYIVTAVPPFSGGSPVEVITNRLHEVPKPVQFYNNALSDGFAGLIDSMLSKEKELRPTVDHIILTLKKLQDRTT